MSCGIYKITNTINNKIYIGKSINIEHRWKEHKSKIKDLNKQNHLYRAMRKYNLDNFHFEIIELCPNDNATLCQKEQYWINFYNSYENGYNETRGGEGHFQYSPSNIYSLWDEGYSIPEIINKMHCERQTIDNCLKNYPNFSTEKAIKRSESIRRQKISNNASVRQSYPVFQYDLEGNFIAEYPNLTAAAQHFGYNKDNSITKVINNTDRKLAYGYQWSKDKVEKMSPIKNAIRNINTGKVFPSIREAAKWANIDKEGIRRVLNGVRKTAGKHPNTGEKLLWEKIV